MSTQTTTIGAFKIEVYQRTNLANYPDCPYAVKFTKKTVKGKLPEIVISHVVQRTEDAAISYAAKIAEIAQKETDNKEKRKQANKGVDAALFYQVGDILVNSWGWEQTNIDYYQVVKVGNKTIDIQAIYSKVVEGSYYSHGMACEVVAAKDSFIENGKSYRLRVKQEGRLSNPETYHHFTKWSGTAKYQSWYA